MTFCVDPTEGLDTFLTELLPDQEVELLHLLDCPACQERAREKLERRSLAAEAGGIGLLVVQILTTIVIAAVLYAGGETASLAMRKFGARFAGKRGEDVVLLAGRAIRGVALGVVVTALAQALLGGLGLVVSGVRPSGTAEVVLRDGDGTHHAFQVSLE